MLEPFRIGLKSIVGRPVLGVAIVLPLVLATAVSTALFSIADGLYFRPLPLKNVESTITVSWPPSGSRRAEVVKVLTSPAARIGLQDAFTQSPLFALTLNSPPFSHFNSFIVRETGLKVAVVDIRFFDYFGLSPALGRPFAEDDQTATAGISSADGILPVILSDSYWRREFGASAAVISQHVTTAGRRVSIVGVMAPGVKFPGRTDIWTLLPGRSVDHVSGFAQLAPGATMEQVRAAFPSLDFAPLRESLLPSGASTVIFMFGTALALLLLAWVQIGGLVLTSASDRLREIAVRMSLGAGHLRIAGQFAAESFWLVAVALGLSFFATPSLTHVLIDLLPNSLTAAQYLEPDSRAVVFAGLVTAAGFVLLTLTPLAFTSRSAPLQLMQGRVAESISTSKVRRGLLVAQMACTALLLYVAVLSALSYLNVLRFDYGFDAENVVLIEPSRPIYIDGQGAEYSRAFMAHEGRVAATAERLRNVPGVRIATVIDDSPLRDRYPETRSDVREINGQKIEHVRARIVGAGSNIVEALGATVVAGTDLDQAEYRGRRDVVLVNETLARQLSPVVSVIGSRIKAEWLDAKIVGVVKDLVDTTPDRPASPLFIQTREAGATAAHQILVRTSRPAKTLLPTLRKVVEEDFGPMRSTQLYLLADDVDATVEPWRGRAAVLSLVAMFGLPLAVIGIASGLFFFVRTRTRELGIRLALGATAPQARSVVLNYAKRVVVSGGLAGIAVGMLAGRMMAGQLFGVGAVSLVTTTVVACIVGAMAWLAAYVPARRASRVDPAIVLRAE